MINVIEKEINPILSKCGYPQISVKIGMDEDIKIMFQYGYDKSSLVDIIVHTMNVTAKVTLMASPDKISVGKNL